MRARVSLVAAAPRRVNLIDGGRCDEEDLGVVASDDGVRDDLAKVLLVLV